MHSKERGFLTRLRIKLGQGMGKSMARVDAWRLADLGFSIPDCHLQFLWYPQIIGAHGERLRENWARMSAALYETIETVASLQYGRVSVNLVQLVQCHECRLRACSLRPRRKYYRTQREEFGTNTGGGSLRSTK